VSYEISTDPDRLDRALIHRFLSEEAYWAKGRSREIVDRAIDHSMAFGVYGTDGEQVGFARVVTDRCTFAWIADVFVVAEHRGQGLGKRLVAAIMDHPELRTMGRWLLGTADAHGLYSQYGFEPLKRVERFMARERPIDPGHHAAQPSGSEDGAERVER
jgi:GNAT superfamily N-acetyltransferase